jgi:hypothetical protein
MDTECGRKKDREQRKCGSEWHGVRIEISLLCSRRQKPTGRRNKRDPARAPPEGGLWVETKAGRCAESERSEPVGPFGAWGDVGAKEGWR